MSLHQDVRGALTQRAEGTTGLPAGRSYEGVPYSPSPGTAFVSFKLMPTERRQVAMGDGGEKLYEGLFLIDLVYPQGQGSGAAELVGDAVMERFDASVSIILGATTVRVRHARRAGAIEDTQWYRVPVTVEWFLHRRS